MSNRPTPSVSILLVMALLSVAPSSEAVWGNDAASTPPGALRLKTFSVRDKAAGGIEAFRMLIPVGWQTSGGVEWRHTQSNLATVAMRIWNPTGSEALELFPIVPFTWTQGGVAFFPPGSSIYMGNEVRPVLAEPEMFVQQVVLPRHRKHVPGLRVVATAALPDAAKAVAASIQEAGVSKHVKAAKVRIEYQEGGKTLQEDLYCVMVYSTSSILPGTTFWGPERLYSFKAEKGKLDEASKVLQAMVASMTINLAWYNQYLQVVELWQQGQMQSIRSAGELSRYIAKTNDEISAIIRQSYEARQASQERISANFSRTIRGVESYHNPFEGRSVELPSGYRDVWVSSKGEYLFSNDANLNPNVGDTQTWKLMKATP